MSHSLFRELPGHARVPHRTLIIMIVIIIVIIVIIIMNNNSSIMEFFAVKVLKLIDVNHS